MPRSHTLKATAIKIEEQIIHLSPIQNHNSLFHMNLGILQTHWSNCESVLAIYAMVLTQTERETADIYWHSLINTRARINYIWSLANEIIKKKKQREDLYEILKDLRGLTKTRNFYAHAQYRYDDNGKLIIVSGSRLTPEAAKPIKRTIKTCNSRTLHQIINTTKKLTKLNKNMWDMVFTLEAEFGGQLEGLPQQLLLKQEQALSHLRQKKGK